MSSTQYPYLFKEKDIIKYFLDKKAINPQNTVSQKTLIEDNVNILSDGFTQLYYFGVILEAKKGHFYLNIKNLKRFQKYMFIHTFSYSSIATVFVLLMLVIFLRTFDIILFFIALGISMLIFLPPSIISYRRYSLPELREIEEAEKSSEKEAKGEVK